MQWQLAIHIKLSLETNTLKVITDHTGILSSTPFLTWLSERKISHAIAHNTTDLISFTAQSDLFNIITPKSDIPAFITNKWSHKTFNWSDIPLNGNGHKAFQKLSAIEITGILDAVYQSDRHQLINESDVPVWLEKAKELFSKSQIVSLEETIKESIKQTATLDSILSVGKQWGELLYLSFKTKEKPSLLLQTAIDKWSKDFFANNGMEKVMYASTPKTPKSVDRILSHIKSQNQSKVALVCFDCMGWAEWMLLKDFLKEEAISFEEDGIFALLPSVTAISRSAIFQGSREVYNLKSPGRNTEAKSFASFFQDKHTRYFTDKDELSEDALLGYDTISLLYTFFDDLCHSTHFAPSDSDKEPYFEAVNRYLAKSRVKENIKLFQNNGFTIFFCSDHGSMVAIGNGQKLEKFLVDNFAKRAAIIPTEASEHVSQQTIKIPFVNDKLLALPEGRTMFANKNTIEVNHGGITLEEMIVPFIKIIK
jgi:hypothetical protein